MWWWPVLAGCVAAWLLWLWRRVPDYRLSWRLPSGRWAAPILGHTRLFLGCSQEGIFARMCSMLIAEMNRSPYTKLWLGTQLVVGVFDADCVEKVIFNRSVLHKGHILHAADKIVGNGMLFGSGPEVRQRRRGIVPSFKTRMLEQYLQIFHKKSKLLQQVLNEQAVDGKDFHIEKQIHCCAFDAVNETSIGVRTNCLLGENGQLMQSFIDLYGLVYEEILKPWLYHGRNIMRTFGFKYRLDRICENLDKHIGHALQRKKAELQGELMKNIMESKTDTQKNSPNGAKETDSSIQNGGKGFQNGGKKIQNGGLTDDLDVEWKSEDGVMTTLEYLLRSDFDISDDDLVMEMKNIFLASSDTVAQVVAFLFKMFAIHPAYQERAYEEVVSVLGEGEATPTPAQLARLNYLDCCIKEALRLFPIAPLIPRMCEQPLKLDDNITLHTGTSVLVCVFWLHRSPRHWTHPELFHPPHFEKEAVERRHRAAFIPFSGGPHSCIGQQYAMLFMKIMASMLLLKFRVEPAESDYATCKFHSTQNGRLSNTARSVEHAAAIENGGHADKIQNGGHSGEIQNGGHSDALQNGGHSEAIQNGVRMRKIDTPDQYHKAEGSEDEKIKPNRYGNEIEKCDRVNCTGRYIAEDYVGKMKLCSDISIRLIGGIDVKVNRRE